MINIFKQGGMTQHLARKLIPLTLAITLLIAILAPLTYWSLAHRNLQRTAELYAADLARQLRQVVLDSPELWRYQTYKFMDIIEKFHPNIEVSGFRILDEKGKLITGHDYHPVTWSVAGEPLSFREDLRASLGSAPIIFNNRVVGAVEVLADDLPIIRSSAILLFFSALFGITLATLAFQMPVRVVRKMEGEINRLITDLRGSEESVRTLNAELEEKVAERTKELVAAQEELVRREKLAILGQLSGSVGHELRNPLGVMSNAVYYLKMVHSDATTVEYLDIIKQEIDNSLRIITDLLDFARTRPPQTGSVNARQLLAESLGKCTIPENVVVQIDLPEDLPQLKVDPQQLGQVFSNLLTNAVQAMADGGELRITARQIMKDELRIMSSDSKFKIQNSKLPDFIAISVADSGTGITPENLKKLFQPLFTTKTKGIGLGLVVCKNLIDANGGRIEVTSQVGQGTTFTVVLPAITNEK